MNHAILVVNCGSSSIKYALISSHDREATCRIEGIAESLGDVGARIKHKGENGEATQIDIPGADHQQAMQQLLSLLGDNKPIAIGHRIVHGGEDFTQASLLTDAVMAAIEKNAALAPLHNPANLIGIAATKAIFPELPQVGVFDTAFHQTMPAHAYRYALPKALYESHGIRRYGFHGTSHAYITERADELAGCAGNGWLTAHLGNGCSTSAVYAGKCVDTSMGLTPLEGVPMGTRSGDIDPGIIFHLHRELGMSIDDIDAMLNKKSGLLGISDTSNDMRALEAAVADGNPDAQLAITIFAYRVAKSLAALSCALPKLTGILFTGGIGENGADIRRAIIGHLQHFGIDMDNAQNAALVRGKEGHFHTPKSAIQLWVIPTDEEGRIASETRQLLDQ